MSIYIYIWGIATGTKIGEFMLYIALHYIVADKVLVKLGHTSYV